MGKSCKMARGEKRGEKKRKEAIREVSERREGEGKGRGREDKTRQERRGEGGEGRGARERHNF